MRRFIERSWLPSLLLTLAVTAWIVFVGEGIDAYYRSRLGDMVHGTAYRPYVYRVLVPGLARVATALTPAAARDLLTDGFEQWSTRPPGWSPPDATESVFVVVVMAASLWGFAAGVRGLSRAVFAASETVHQTLALIALACLPLTFGPFSRQIYDFTTLCLFTWGLVLIVQQRWAAFAATFLLACLNKESSILLALVFVAHAMSGHSGLSRGRALALLAFQIAAFSVVRAGVVYAFRDNPGDTVEIHLFGHNQYVLTHPGEMSKRLYLLLGAASVGVWSWAQQPRYLRRTMAVLGPSLLVMGVTVGMFDEIRAYYEIYSVVVLMAALTISRWLGVSIEPRRSPVGSVTA